MNDSAKYLAVLDHYSRPDNTLFVPETGGTGNGSRMCFAALGRGAIGWSPFGLDYTRATPESIAPVGMNYRMLEPIMREVAQLNFEGKVKAVEEEAGQTSATLDFGAWSAIINFTGSRRRSGGLGGRPRRDGAGERHRSQQRGRRARAARVARPRMREKPPRPRPRDARWLRKLRKINSSSPAVPAPSSSRRRPERSATGSGSRKPSHWKGSPTLHTMGVTTRRLPPSG